MKKNIYEIKENVVLVDGAKNAAIYDLNSGDVFAINSKAKEIIFSYMQGEQLDEIGIEYLDLLSENHLIFNSQEKISEYHFTRTIPSIKNVWLEITQACNMRCLHCYEGNHHVSCSDSLTLEEWEQVIDQIIDLGVKNIIVIGGEPCIHKNIIDILKYIRRCSDSVGITLFTNGYFLKDELLEVVIANNVSVKMSLYGHNSQVHDTITGVKGSFDRIEKLVFNLKENNIKVNIAITMMKENEEYYDSIRALVEKWPINGFKFDVIREVINGKQSEHMPHNPEVKNLVQRKEANFYVKKVDFDRNCCFNSCWSSKFVIEESGNVLPCVFARNHTYGNVRNIRIEELFREQSKLLEFWGINLDKVDVCKDCEYRYACADCRALAESQNGLYEKNPRCLYDPYKGEWENE